MWKNETDLSKEKSGMDHWVMGVGKGNHSEIH